MNKAYLGIGTNMGNRFDNLSKACELLRNSDSIYEVKESKLYETKPWGYTEQADFLNMCVEIETEFEPYELLEYCQKIEKELHRERIVHWGPRTIDVDILFFNDVVLTDEKLLIPHPRIQDRAFVLIPLMDLNEELLINKKSIKEYLNLLSAKEIEEVKELVGYEKKPI
nr:2-amino-4-hydroxy-6-hydroxymethyldihydropteridine diphosphokinase [Clostridioides difficile]